jgi:hypothetical protein
MKLTGLILISIIICFFEQDETIQRIKSECYAIDAAINNLNHIRIQDAYFKTTSSLNGGLNQGYPNEGKYVPDLAMINLDKYDDGKSIKKIVVSFDGGWADLISDYYYVDSTMIYVRKKYSGYLKPKWDTKHNKNENKEFLNEYYFVFGKLVFFDNHGNTIYNDAETESKTLSDSKLYYNFKK